MCKRLVDDAQNLAKLSKYVRQNGNKTEVGGNLEVDGEITKKGGEPIGGGTQLYLHSISFESNGSGTIYVSVYSTRKDGYIVDGDISGIDDGIICYGGVDEPSEFLFIYMYNDGDGNFVFHKIGGEDVSFHNDGELTEQVIKK